jgi:hypothetical protein
MAFCHNNIRFDYNCREALDDLNIAIRRAANENEERREQFRQMGSRYKIVRKW